MSKDHKYQVGDILSSNASDYLYARWRYQVLHVNLQDGKYTLRDIEPDPYYNAGTVDIPIDEMDSPISKVFLVKRGKQSVFHEVWSLI